MSVFGLIMLLGSYYEGLGMLCSYGGNLTIKNKSNTGTNRKHALPKFKSQTLVNIGDYQAFTQTCALPVWRS